MQFAIEFQTAGRYTHGPAIPAIVHFRLVHNKGNSGMKRLLPSVGEIGVFALVAIGCAALMSLIPAWDIGLAVGSMPVFIMAAVMGLRSRGHLAAATIAAETSPEQRPPNRQ
jgi:hypothetical protein